MKFYRLLADPTATKKWHLREPVDKDGAQIDARLFTEALPVAVHELLTVPLRRRGERVDFNFGDFDFIVTPAAINSKLESIVGPAIQRIPISLESSKERFEILNVLDKVKCIDEARSSFTRWTSADGRPEKVGEYRMITQMKLDGKAAQGHDLFRVGEWPIALVASARVKVLLEECGATGVTYHEVS